MDSLSASRILVVDDDPAICKLLTAKLKSLDVAFKLPNVPAAIKTRALVVSGDPPNGIGLQFLKLNDRDARNLQSYISARIED